MSTLRVTNIQDLNGNQVLSLSGGNATIAGDLTIQGTTTSIETTNLIIEDKNIILGQTDPAATDATADGGGITLKGTTDKTIAWVNNTDAWTSSERFSVPLGTEATPSLTFTGDPNTGIYSPGANQVAIGTGGAGRLFVDASGNVGIGTSAPARQLSVTTATNDDGIVLTNSSANGGRLRLESTGTGGRTYHIVSTANGSGAGGGKLVIFDNTASDTARLVIDSSGNVGIGTSSPLAKLHIGGATEGIRFGVSGATAKADVKYTAAGAEFLDLSIQGTTVGYGNIRFSTGPTPDERMRIDSSGNVGIGITNPSEALDVVGNILATGRVRSKNGTVGDVGLGFTDDHNVGLYRPESDTLGFVTGSSERVRIDSSGNVGIGTSTPNVNLQVNSAGNTVVEVSSTFADSTATGFRVDTTGNASIGRYYFQKSGVTRGSISYVHHATAADELLTFNVAGGADKLVINGSGRVGIGTTSPTGTLQVQPANSNIPASALVVRQNNGADTSQNTFSIEIDPVNNISRLISTGTTNPQMSFYTGASESARIDSNGNVGIGITNPSAKLDIRGSADSGVINNLDLWNTSVATGNQGALLRLITRNAANSSTSSTDIVKYQGGESSFRATDSSGFFTFYTGGYNERIRILSGGNVGINTTTPGSRLAVNGSITESTDGGTTYHNVVTAQDIGTDPNQVPLNQFLGQLAFMDSVGDVPTASSAPQDNLSVNFEYVSDTSLKIRMRGADGVVRSVTLTLS